MNVYNINGTAITAAYDVNETSLNGVYDIYGDYIPFTEPITPLPLDYTSYEFTDLFDYTGNGFNGLDQHNGIIAQLMASNKLYMFDIDTQEEIATAITIKSDHGDSASFSQRYYQNSDEFPLLYITSDSNPAKVYVNRITRSSTSLVETLSFPLDKTGYYAAHAYDEANQIMYMVGYSQQNYLSDNSGANKTVISKWDMTNLTDNGSNNYTPAFISSYEIGFIYCMQGISFFDGYIWISSGYNNGRTQNIYGIDPITGTKLYTITMNNTEELEGVAWVYDQESNKYWMLVGQQFHNPNKLNYIRIDFDTLT